MSSICSDKKEIFFQKKKNIHDVKKISWRTSGFILSVERGPHRDTPLGHGHCGGVPVQVTVVHGNGYFLTSCPKVRVDDQGGVISVWSLDVYISCIIQLNWAIIEIRCNSYRESSEDLSWGSFSYNELSQRLSLDMFQREKKSSVFNFSHLS